MSGWSVKRSGSTACRRKSCTDFCADGLQEGDSLQGQFLIISDYGEYTLPWKVTVRREAAAGIAGKVSTLAGFTELARTALENGGTVFLQ